jgi:hypothetical protein
MHGGDKSGGSLVKRRSLARYLKFLPLVALFAFGVALISLPKDTEATPLGAPSLSLTVVPINGSTIVTGMYTDDTPAGSGSATLTASPAIGSFLPGATVALNNGETVTVSGATVTVTEDTDTLAASKTITATFQCTTAGLTTFTITHGGQTSPQSVTLLCGDFYGQFPVFPGGYPPFNQFPFPNTQYPTFNTATAVTVSASPATVSCASTSQISVAVKDANGNMAPNGTSVTVSASSGTISPNVVSTTGGIASTSFTAPGNTNGTATVTATSGQGTGYATVAFTCTGTSTTSTTSTSAPVYIPPASFPVGPVTISPPNTGDAGLADGARSSTNAAGIALVALSVIGLTAGGLALRQQRMER